jgi:hypothetical protein
MAEYKDGGFYWIKLLVGDHNGLKSIALHELVCGESMWSFFGTEHTEAVPGSLFEVIGPVEES